MSSVNKIFLIGNLGADPEMAQLPSGDAIANLRLATTDTWKDKAGNKQEATEWHRVSFFGRQAEVCRQYLKKGSQIYVEGSIHTRKWQDKDGQDRYSTEIKGDRLQMLGSAARDTAVGVSDRESVSEVGEPLIQNRANVRPTSTNKLPEDPPF